MARKPQRKPPQPQRRAPKAKTAPKPSRVGGDFLGHPGAVTSTGKIDKTVNKQLAALPFVRNRKRGEKGGRNWWSVKPTGNYTKDYHRGRLWAHAALPLLRYNVGAPLLSWIVVDMIAAGERNGLVLGFVREIGDQLKTAHRNLVALASVASAMANPRQ